MLQDRKSGPLDTDSKRLFVLRVAPGAGIACGARLISDSGATFCRTHFRAFFEVEGPERRWNSGHPSLRRPNFSLKISTDLRSCVDYKRRATLLVMLIDHIRLYRAAVRLARRELNRRIDAKRYDIKDPREFEAVLRRAMIPRATAKLAMRLWKRGHIIIDFKTREVGRHPDDVAAMSK